MIMVLLFIIHYSNLNFEIAHLTFLIKIFGTKEILMFCVKIPKLVQFFFKK